LPLNSDSFKLDPRTYDRALGCVHCGLCLPVCPTYLLTGHEAESPRGRIQLMRGLSDGAIAPTDAVRNHLDLCLDCRACETACPSGVVYHELIEETRAKLTNIPMQDGQLPRCDPILNWIIYHILTHPKRIRLALLPIRVLQKLGLFQLLRRLGFLNFFPAQWRKLILMVPPGGPLWTRLLPESSRAISPQGSDWSVNFAGKAHGLPSVGSSDCDKTQINPLVTVGFLTGCVGGIISEKTNRHAVELLNACGFDVFAPRRQRCCGAIHHHGGKLADAQARARRNIDLFLPLSGKPVDFIATNIAGCGAMLKEYQLLLRDDPNYRDRAGEFSRKVRDVTQLLAGKNLPPMKYSVNMTAAYHDACHLAHAQKVTAEPRELLAKILGLKLMPLPESDLCCGAAGVYNLMHPEMAGDLADRKLANIAGAGVEILIAGNIGCAMHIQSQAAARGRKLRVVHPVELLHQAAFGSEPS
jgi:glycolate oxidase iron-sulfur subunit